MVEGETAAWEQASAVLNYGRQTLEGLWTDVGLDELERLAVCKDIALEVERTVHARVADARETKAQTVLKARLALRRLNSIHAQLGTPVPSTDFVTVDEPSIDAPAEAAGIPEHSIRASQMPLTSQLRKIESLLAQAEAEMEARKRAFAEMASTLRALMLEQFGTIDGNALLQSCLDLSGETDLSDARKSLLSDAIEKGRSAREARSRDIQDCVGLMQHIWARVGTNEDEANPVWAAFDADVRAGGTGLEPSTAVLEQAKERLALLQVLDQERRQAIEARRASLFTLWTRVQTPREEQQAFLSLHPGISLHEMRRHEAMIASLETTLQDILPGLIATASMHLASLDNALLESLTPSVDAITTGDCVSVAVLEELETAVRGAEERLEERRGVLGLIERRDTMRGEAAQLKHAAQDPSRLLDKSAGSFRARQLEERRRNMVSRELPRITEKLWRALGDWQDTFGKPFIYRGQAYKEIMDQQRLEEEQEAEADKARREDERQRIKAKRSAILQASAVTSSPPVGGSVAAIAGNGSTPKANNPKTPRDGSARVRSNANPCGAPCSRGILGSPRPGLKKAVATPISLGLVEGKLVPDAEDDKDKENSQLQQRSGACCEKHDEVPVQKSQSIPDGDTRTSAHSPCRLADGRGPFSCQGLDGGDAQCPHELQRALPQEARMPMAQWLASTRHSGTRSHSPGLNEEESEATGKIEAIPEGSTEGVISLTVPAEASHVLQAPEGWASEQEGPVEGGSSNKNTPGQEGGVTRDDREKETKSEKDMVHDYLGDCYYTDEERVEIRRELVREMEQRKEELIAASAAVDTASKICFKKGDVLGAGSFGQVFLGLNEANGELLAVKEVDCSRAGEAAIRDLESEIKMLQLLRHPNIVAYYGVQRHSGVSVLVEYCAGGSIASVIANFGALNEKVVRSYTRQILCGLDYLHKHCIVHRDVKCANVLLDADGNCKVADFGASKNLSQINGEGQMSMKGTPFFMAPEVVLQNDVGRQSDLWSVGCCVVEMATSKPPFSGQFSNVAALLFHIARNVEPPVLPATLSDECHDFSALCFRRNPKERPSARRLLRHPFVANWNAQHGVATDEMRRSHLPRRQNRTSALF